MIEEFPRKLLEIDLDSTKGTKEAIQQLLEQSNAFDGFEFQGNDTRNDANSKTNQNFFNFLQALLALKANDKSFHRVGYYFTFSKLFIGLNEAKLLVEGIKAFNVTNLSLRFHQSQVSLEALEKLVSAYPTRNETEKCKYNGCKNRNTLVIRNTVIDSHRISCLSRLLSTTSSLNQLELTCTHIGDDGAIALANALYQNTSLIKLHLCYNGIKASGAKAIAEMLCKNSTLESLCLSSNYGMGNIGLEALAETLRINSSLQQLILRNVNCFNQGLIALAEGLAQNCGLKQLDFGYSTFYEQDGMRGAEALGRSLKQNCTLNDLGLVNVFPRNDYGWMMSALVKALDGKQTELKINLSYNSVSQFDNDAFNALMECNAPLLTLNLDGSGVQSNHIEVIAHGIQQQTFNVKSLILSLAEADDDSVIALFDALIESKQSCNLLELSLNYVQGVTNIGAQQIVAKLPLTNLQSLELNALPIGNDGVQQIASFLNDTEIFKLGLGSVEMEDSGLIALSKALEINTKLTFLSIDGNLNITTLGKQALLNALREYNMILTYIGLRECGNNKLDSEIEFYLELNKAKREKFRDANLVPVRLIPILFGGTHKSPSVIFWILQMCPHVFLL